MTVPADMLQLGRDALRDFECTVNEQDESNSFWQRGLADLRFTLASAIEQRRIANALERIALAVEMMARREEVQP